jgi:23S rRNA (adenine2503-C2)-methyltransferase
MGCKFCVTGKMGYVRNLKASEIVGQLIAVKRYLENKSNLPHTATDADFTNTEQMQFKPWRKTKELTEKPITNIVFMGMGEPVDNLDNVMRALEILKDPLGLDYSHRKITISSVGLIDGLNIIKPKDAGIAISLNAADDTKRSFLMPINRIYPVRSIINFAKGFKGTNRTRITFEYILIRDFNDSLEDAKQLSEILKGVRCKINLIPYNESPYIEFKTPDPEKTEQFQAYLHSKNFTAMIRNSRGQDIGGACGQLGMGYLDESAHS